MNRNAKWAILASTTEITKRVPDHWAEDTRRAVLPESAHNQSKGLRVACEWLGWATGNTCQKWSLLIKATDFRAKQNAFRLG